MDYHNYATPNEDYVLFPEEQVVYASFWERFGAAFLDGLILIIPNYILKFIFGEISAIPASIALSWLYTALMESGNGQATLGKRGLGLKVTSVRGDRISFGQASARFFGKYLSLLILLIGYFMMLWDKRSQTLHDKIADCLVVKA